MIENIGMKIFKLNFEGLFQNFFQGEIKEIQEHKLRIVGFAVCLILVIIFSFDGNAEKIDVSETDEKILTENISGDIKNVEVKEVYQSTPNEKIKIVQGANSDELSVRDPFESPPQKKSVPSMPEPAEQKIFTPPAIVSAEKIFVPEQESFVLIGTAISGKNKFALIKKSGAKESLFFSVGDSLDGKKISDITDDFILFSNGEKLFIGE